jgi:chemotaxis protein methyltransferase CheR
VSRAGSAAWLPTLAALAGERLGLDYPRERWADLERSIDVAAREQGDDNTDAFARRLLGAAAGGPQLDLLARALTVGETYFFRERRCFEVLEQELLPALIAERRSTGRRLRLWSAGCCTGEEAYSLAMVVDRLLPQRQGWEVSILATDVNPHFLRRAARAEFGPWSFRDAPAGLQRYFMPAGDGRLALLPHIREMVSFAQLNLAGPGYPSAHSGTEAMDLILCRNVLMYFTPPQAQRVMGRLQAALRDGGWLCVGAAEAPLKTLQGLLPAAIDGTAFYRKAAATPTAQPATGSPAPAGALPTATPPPAPHDNATPDPLQHARTLADAGALEPARAAVEQLVAAAKLDPEAHYLHAVILQELGQDAGAEQALKRALYLDPGFALAHHALGQLALRGGRPVPAQRHFHHALAALERLDAASVLPHSGGLAAGHLRALIEALLAGGRAA